MEAGALKGKSQATSLGSLMALGGWDSLQTARFTTVSRSVPQIFRKDACEALRKKGIVELAISDSETSDPEPQGKGDANLAIWQFGWSSVQQMYALLNLRRLRWRLRDVTSGTSIHGSVQINMILLVCRKAKKPLLALCARRALGIS